MKPYLLQHFLESSVERFPDKEAIRHGSTSVTFAVLHAQSKALGAVLVSQSPVRGERVAILLDKCIEQVVAILGVLYADKVFVVVSPGLHPKQVAHILSDCDIDAVITDRASQARIVDEAANGTRVRRVICVEDFSALIAAQEGTVGECRNITDDISNIIYTSGSTGLPKGIVLTHRNLIDGARIVSEYLQVSESDRILAMLPFSFDYGLNQLASALYRGCTLVLYKFGLPNDFLRILATEKITGVAAIPPIWASVFNSRFCDITKAAPDLPALRYITNSGGRIPVPTVRQIRTAFPKAALYLMYGLTEAFRSTFLDPAEVDRRPDSMGKAIPNVEIEVINDEGESCGPNESGELIHRGACIARGYWKNPEKTREVYRPNPLLPKGSQFLETVVYSGDLVRRDRDGFLYFLGRRDHQIKTLGYRVSPTEVESLIAGCAGVSEVIVFGLDDPALGQKVRALVVVSEALTTKAILEYCRVEAPYYMVPREVFIVSVLPRTPNGKIDRPRAIEDSKAEHGL